MVVRVHGKAIVDPSNDDMDEGEATSEADSQPSNEPLLHCNSNPYSIGQYTY